MIEWPETLPLPAEGHDESPLTTVVETNLQGAGPIMRRRRFALRVRSANLNWTFTRSQFTEFKTFYKEALYEGTAKFLIEIKQSSGLVWNQAAFVAGYSYRHEDGYFHVSARMELEVV